MELDTDDGPGSGSQVIKQCYPRWRFENISTNVTCLISMFLLKPLLFAYHNAFSNFSICIHNVAIAVTIIIIVMTSFILVLNNLSVAS